MHPWLHDLQQLLAHGDAAVLVTVARVEGSAPREAGTKMVVTRERVLATIGGGHLEWRAIDIGRQLLKEGGHGRPRRLERLALGPSLGQCCGGAVTLAFERLTIADLGWVTALAKRLAAGMPSVRSVPFGPVPDPVLLTDATDPAAKPDCLLWDGTGPERSGALLTETIALDNFHVVLFGAGHVGAALMQVLASLPCTVRWVDERDAQFPPVDAANITIEANDAPEGAIDEAPPGTYFLVMTHSHALDQQLAERILRRADYTYFGLIGSLTKRKQFEHRLAARGIDPAQLARMICPIGVAGISDKAPEMIAVAVAAQLLRVREQQAAARAGTGTAAPMRN
jgi:xanthine dehydrogenase accessory factor